MPEQLTKDTLSTQSNYLTSEARACAKHLDEEGMGYSADVMRRAVAEIERLQSIIRGKTFVTGSDE